MSDIVIITATEGKNLELAQNVKQLCEQKGINASIINIAQLNLPLYSSQTVNEQSVVASTLEPHIAHCLNSRAYVFLSPEYNGSTAPTLTNFIAWISVVSDYFRRCFNGKVAAIMSYSGAGTNVLQIMRLQLAYLGVNVIGRQVLANASKPPKEESLHAIIDELLRLT